MYRANRKLSRWTYDAQTVEVSGHMYGMPTYRQDGLARLFRVPPSVTDRVDWARLNYTLMSTADDAKLCQLRNDGMEWSVP